MFSKYRMPSLLGKIFPLRTLADVLFTILSVKLQVSICLAISEMYARVYATLH